MSEPTTTEAYPGELAMFRGLVRTLRMVVRPDDADMGEVRRLLWQHASDDAAARTEAEGKSSRTPADATPDFFQPGRAYRSRRCADLRFECLALSAEPDGGDQQAIGWRYGPPHNGVRPHRLAALGVDDFACCNWDEITEGGECQ